MSSPTFNSEIQIEPAKEVQRAVDALNAGELVALPMETVYGLAGRADRSGAVNRLRQLVSQGKQVVYNLHLGDPEQISSYTDISRPMERTVARFQSKAMPGPLTLLLEQAIEVTRSKFQQAGIDPAAVSAVQQESGPLGFRCPEPSVTRRILREVDGPVVAGRAGKWAFDADAAASALSETANIVVNGGPSRYARPSTVVRVDSRGVATVEREGVFDQRMIRNMQQFTILMVCTGNTCRSPMAEAIARRIIAEDKGVPESELSNAGVSVISAGAFAMDGTPASPEAVQAMQSEGIDLTSHRSRALSRELINRADVIFAMTQSHREAVLEIAPDAASKVHRLDPDADIEDPIGADALAYTQTAAQIRQALPARLKEITR